MSFNINTDTNYVLYLQVRNTLSGQQAQLFDQALAQWICLQTTNGATLTPSVLEAGLQLCADFSTVHTF